MKEKTKINLIAINTLSRREYIRIMRIWPQTILPAAINTMLYFIIFGHFLGGRLGEMNNVQYATYLAPGFIIMSIITNSYNNVASSFFSERFVDAHYELTWSPVSFHSVVIGYILGGILRSFICGLVVMFVASVYTNIHIFHPIYMLCIALITSTLFALIGFINALFSKRFDSITTIPAFILTPLTYLGGVFYSIDLLPNFWYKVSLFNPILYIINAFRYSMLNVSDINVESAMAICSIITAALYILCYTLLKKGIGMSK